MSRTVLLLTGLLGFGAQAAAQTLDYQVTLQELEMEHALTSEVVTPHTKWAQPYVLGKTRVLFFTYGHNTDPRECVELMQRFDLEAQAVFRAYIHDTPRTHWHGREIGEERMGALLEQKWDCFALMGGVSTDEFPAEPLGKLLRQVQEGAGLVLVGTDDSRLLNQENRIVPLPSFLSPGPVGEAFTMGEGRGIRLPARPEIGYYEGWEVDYDYWAERLGRGLLWAAGKEPRTGLRITLDRPKFALNELASNAIGFTWEVAHADDLTDIKAEMRVRRAGRPAAFEILAQSVAPDQPHHRAIGPLRWGAGDYHVDLRLVGPKGVVDWATAPFKVTAPVRISALDLDREWGEVGEHLTGRVTIDGETDTAGRLWVTLKDRRGRQLQRQVLPTAAARQPFDFRIEPWMPMLLTVEATVVQDDAGDNEIASDYRYLRVTKRHRGRWNFLVWDAPVGTLAPYAEEQLARTGVTLQLARRNPPPWAAAFDVAWVPYTTRITAQRDEQGVMQPFCWNDEAAVQAEVERLSSLHLPARQHGVFGYSLGDENETLGCCLSPHCAVAYRRYLQQEYGDLETLNLSWATTFATWDDVGLAKPGDNDESHSLEQKNYPRWFDRQAFKSYNYLQYCRRYAEAYREIDPLSRTGFEGGAWFDRGDDVDLLVRTMDWWVPYGGTHDEVLRSLAPPGFARANWQGYVKGAGGELWWFWRMVTRGMDSVWWWRWDCIGPFHGWLAPDLRLYPERKIVFNETQVVRDGLGDLLRKSTMLGDGIAVLHSYPSVFAHALEEGGSFGGYQTAHLAVISMIRELGLQFDYVTDRQMRLGEFDPQRWKVLFLPRIEALGDQEAQVIRQFAEQGGTVIADVRVGVYDGRCKPRPRGVLDDLFGVTRGASVPAKSARAALEGESPLSFEEALVDPAVSLGDGIAGGTAGGTPVAITRQVGQGRVMLLNFAFGSFPRLNVHDTPEAAADTVRSWLSRAGIAPSIALFDKTDARAREIELIRWRNGDLEILALFPQAHRALDPRWGGWNHIEPVRVQLPRPAYVYDLRHRQALGRQEVFTTTLVPFRANFFVLCEKPAPAPVLQWQQDPVTRGEVARATISVPGAEGLHALRLRARCGTQDLEWFNQNILVDAQARTVDVPVALNDPTGTYEVSFIDLFTNQPTTAELTVR